MAGAPARGAEHVPLGSSFRVRPELAFFLPVQVEHSPTLGLVAMPRPTRGSGDFVSLLGTDGFVELPPGPREIPAGHLAPLYRW
jgi:molybdopterin biosynthesis enzyme